MRVLVGSQYAMKIDKLNRRQDPRGGTVKQEYKVRAPAICCLWQGLHGRICLPVWQHPRFFNGLRTGLAQPGAYARMRLGRASAGTPGRRRLRRRPGAKGRCRK